ncbi:hypothetical protein SAMN05421839_12423 [Halolactibacillus halophilus]|uniref:Uncharacterized protein n=1 Tax=Halolactibacillus halophilus TaxID=306540 RepID=A0A1I5QTB4_9BACI|nr:hypothetical protein [Halolactibacillus halophilus]GEM01909.1 hypothetical protein HHA03_14410 [Halolactibacillus halophilus]SFP49380.1 hypothetical protein SAMN05421839_12423 [Halolactibacillus halophilus]
MREMLLFAVSVTVQIMNSIYIMRIGEDLVLMKRLQLDKVEQSFLPSQKTAVYQLIGYIGLWGIFACHYLFNTPFLDSSARIIAFQTNATFLIGHIAWDFFMTRKELVESVPESFTQGDCIKSWREKLVKSAIWTFFTYFLVILIY